MSTAFLGSHISRMSDLSLPEKLPDLPIPARVVQGVMLIAFLVGQLGISQFVAPLFQIAAVHRPAFRQVDHGPEDLAEHNPVVICVVTPEFRLDVKRALLPLHKTHDRLSDIPQTHSSHERYPKMRKNMLTNPGIGILFPKVRMNFVQLGATFAHKRNADQLQRLRRATLDKLCIQEESHEWSVA
jgi:hypothetical protein